MKDVKKALGMKKTIHYGLIGILVVLCSIFFSLWLIEKNKEVYQVPPQIINERKYGIFTLNKGDLTKVKEYQGKIKYTDETNTKEYRILKENVSDIYISVGQNINKGDMILKNSLDEIVKSDFSGTIFEKIETGSEIIYKYFDVENQLIEISIELNTLSDISNKTRILIDDVEYRSEDIILAQEDTNLGKIKIFLKSKIPNHKNAQVNVLIYFETKKDIYFVSKKYLHEDDKGFYFYIKDRTGYHILRVKTGMESFGYIEISSPLLNRGMELYYRE